MTRKLSRPMAILLALMLFAPLLLVQPPATSAVAPATDPFQRTWARTDQPVASGAVSRTWMWGPEGNTDGIWEDYAESPGGTRLVQYFDKSRMEITHPDAVDDGLWYVTNGLLVLELVTGQMQVGNDDFVDRQPATVNVVGDADQLRPITYALLDPLRSEPGFAVGEPLAVRAGVNDDGSLVRFLDHEKGAQGVTAAYYVPNTNHTVASVFWEFMNSSGLVYENGQYVTAPLFQNPFYATGFPITEAYWTHAPVGGTIRDVLFQCFERRCLTYTPGNPEGWQVEAGNVGLHYHAWRYGQQSVADGPSELVNQLAAKVMQSTNDQARYQALLEVMGHLNIGVYTGEGQAILRGAERGVGDFYLYDFELRMMASSLGRDDRWDLHSIAMMLSNMLVAEEDPEIDPEGLRQLLITGAAESALTPAADDAFIPLLVRQLGLYHPQPFDLFQDVSLLTPEFDALQMFLIISSITLPLLAEQPLANPTSSTLVADSQGILTTRETMRPLADDSPCDTYSSRQGEWKIARWAVGLKASTQFTIIATFVIDGMHGTQLAYSVKIHRLSPEDQRTHFGSAGHHPDAGKELRFSVFVEMQDQLWDLYVKCGWLTGVEFPEKGGISDVFVEWIFLNPLPQFGEIVCPLEGCRKTGAKGTSTQGIATLVFKPRKELLPGIGPIVTEKSWFKVYALYQSRFGNYLGTFNEHVTPKLVTYWWEVERHKPRGYKVELHHHIDWSHTDGGEDHYWKLRICGDDPYAGPWEGTRRWVAYGSGSMDGTWDIQVTFDPSTNAANTSFSWVLAHHKLDFTIADAPYTSARIRITETITSTIDPSATSTVTAIAAIEEDTSCPAN